MERRMSFKWTGISAGLLLIILGCNVLYPNDNRQEARRSIIITIDLDRRQEFFDQLRKFAETNDFSILIDTLSSSDEEFQIYMRRKDVIISGASLSNEYQIGFSDVTTQPPASETVYDYLVSDLERFVSEVPGTTFFIRK
jgi:hypothetical protein